MEKIRYEIDPSNRLIYKKSGRESKVPGFRNVIDGRFRIDKDNSLTYHLIAPQSSLPAQLKLSGDWSLDKEHNLVLTLDKERNKWAGDKLTLRGKILDAKSDRLEFSLSTKNEEGKMQFYILQLSGRWQADERNRLSFLVAKESDEDKVITFNGGWELNKRNQIIYNYEKTDLKTKKKRKHTLTLKGFWDITKQRRLSYIMNQEIGSGFDFKVSLGKPLNRGLQYEIGIGGSPRKKKLIIFGAWKVNPRLGLILEVPTEEGKLQYITFGATCKLDKNYNLELRLKSRQQEDLGIDLKLSRKIFNTQGEAFVQALKEGKETTLQAGFGLRF